MMKAYKFIRYHCLWALMMLTCAAQGVDLERDMAVAVIADRPIILEEVLNHARRSAHLSPLLHAPGGLPRVLDDFIKIRLLIREGRRLEIPQGEDESDLMFAYRVRDRLVKSCPTPGAEEARVFYEAHPEEFSTPRYTRARRIGIEATTPARRDAATQQLEELRAAIQAGEMDFEEAVTGFSQDPLSKDKQGDVGFFPQDRQIVEPLAERLHETPIDGFVGPVTQGDMVFLYQITDRHEPILAPFDESVVRDAEQAFKAHCFQERFDRVMQELRERWPVEYPIPALAPS